MKILAKFFSIVDSLNEMCGNVFCWLNLLLVIIIVYEVVCRYIIGFSNTWAMELSVYMMGGVAFLGAGYTLLHGSHVRIDLIHKHMPPRSRALMDVITYLLLFIACGVLLVYGTAEAYESFIEGKPTESQWAPPLWISQSLIPIGALLLILQGLVNWVRNWTVLLTGQNLLPGNLDIGEGGIVEIAKKGK